MCASVFCTGPSRGGWEHGADPQSDVGGEKESLRQARYRTGSCRYVRNRLSQTVLLSDLVVFIRHLVVKDKTSKYTECQRLAANPIN